MLYERGKCDKEVSTYCLHDLYVVLFLHDISVVTNLLFGWIFFLLFFFFLIPFRFTRFRKKKTRLRMHWDKKSRWYKDDPLLMLALAASRIDDVNFFSEWAAHFVNKVCGRGVIKILVEDIYSYGPLCGKEPISLVPNQNHCALKARLRKICFLIVSWSA